MSQHQNRKHNSTPTTPIAASEANSQGDRLTSRAERARVIEEWSGATNVTPARQMLPSRSPKQSERQDPDFRPRSRRASEATAKTRCASSLEPKLKLAAKATYTVDSAGIEDGVNSMSMQEGKNATTPSIGPTAAKAEVTQGKECLDLIDLNAPGNEATAVTNQKQPMSTPQPNPIGMPIFREPTWKEVYARQQAKIREVERIYGRSLPDAPDNEDDMTVAEPQMKGKQREVLESRVSEWVSYVPETGFDEGQRRLTEQEMQEWMETARTLKRVALNEEIKEAGSWVGDRFFPQGFW